MLPVLVKIGPLTIYSYGVAVAIGFGLSAFLIMRRAKRFGLDKDKIINLLILILAGGIIGARGLYILLNINYYLANPFEIFNLSKGGLVWYGGFASGLAAAIWYIKKNKINFWDFSDLAAPYLALAQSLGRVGCFLNGCCFGMEAKGLQLSAVFHGSPALRYPTQIYSSLTLLLVFVVLRIRQDRRHFNGEIFLGYCVLYSSKRFFMEFLRGDNPAVIYNLTISQILSASLFLVSVFILIYKISSKMPRDF